LLKFGAFGLSVALNILIWNKSLSLNDTSKYFFLDSGFFKQLFFLYNYYIK
jgi:hypothetical protein